MKSTLHQTTSPDKTGATAARTASYSPKAVRGISYPGYTRINRRQLAKLFATDPAFLFNGFIVGNNVNSFHFFGGWYLACRLDGKNAEEMEQSLNSFCFYLDAELGSNAAIFLRKGTAK